MALLGRLRDWEPRFRLLFPDPTAGVRRRLDERLGRMRHWLLRESDLTVPDDRLVASTLLLQSAQPGSALYVATGVLNLQTKLAAVGLPFVELPRTPRPGGRPDHHAGGEPRRPTDRDAQTGAGRPGARPRSTRQVRAWPDPPRAAVRARSTTRGSAPHLGIIGGW
jgi:hypothetical protein